MSDDLAIENVNKHYLDKVMDLADEMDVEATEDIFDSRGMKLIAKGAKISRNLQEKLILHKLRKPLESCITVEGGVSTNIIINAADKLADTNGPIKCILRSAGSFGASPLDILRSIEFGGAMSTMLTIVEKGGEAALEHCVMVSLVSTCLANQMGLSETHQKVAALAGLFHDIGELYIEPEYLKSKRRLLPHEWRHVVVHPRIGEMLISELENYPKDVARAVAEHHERFNGGGYPRQLGGARISLPGQAVSVAEMISGVFMKRDRPLERAELAMKIIPGEHPHPLVSAVTNALRLGETTPGEDHPPTNESLDVVQSLSERIAGVLAKGQEMNDGLAVLSPKAKPMVAQAIDRTQMIRRAFISTGLDVCLSEGEAFFEGRNPHLVFEVSVAAKEIQWRLQDVARDLSLHAAALEAEENAALQPLISMLDGTPAA